MSPGCSKAPAQAAMPHHGVGTMPGCASTGAASAELLGRCHPGYGLSWHRDRSLGLASAGGSGWTWPSGCPQPAGPAGGLAVQPPVPKHSHEPWGWARSLAPGVALGPAHGQLPETRAPSSAPSHLGRGLAQWPRVPGPRPGALRTGRAAPRRAERCVQLSSQSPPPLPSRPLPGGYFCCGMCHPLGFWRAAGLVLQARG